MVQYYIQTFDMNKGKKERFKGEDLRWEVEKKLSNRTETLCLHNTGWKTIYISVTQTHTHTHTHTHTQVTREWEQLTELHIINGQFFW